MAIKHQLSLEIPDTNNVSIFRVSDTSIYSEDIQVKCGTLHITSPGFIDPVTIDVLPNFNLVLNACTLGLINTGCDSDSPALPDGIYHIRYSVSPNDKVYVEYNFLRVTQTLNIYYNELCKIELAACEPSVEIKARLNELRLIKSYIDAAKAKVEECHDSGKGMELLVYAKKRLDRFITGCRTSPGCRNC